MLSRVGCFLFLCTFVLFVQSVEKRNPLFVQSISNSKEFDEIYLPAFEKMVGREKLEELDFYVESNFKLFNSTSYMVPMKDGIQLHTVANFPVGHRGEKLPVVLDRTPYSTEAVQYLIGALFHFKGYIAVAQDMRGRYQSEGVWSYWRKSPQDGYDTINWIAEQSWSNGEVMAFGISADGIAATCQEGHIPPPEALKSQSLWVASGTGYSSTYYNGAYRQALISGWLEGLDEAWYIQTILDHEEYGPWWYPIELEDRWNNTNVPAVHIGGWYDIFSEGTIQSYIGYQENGGRGAKGNQYLIMDPLGHCGGGEYRFPRARTTWVIESTYMMFENSKSTSLLSPYSLQALSICMYVMGPDPSTMTDTDAGNFWACMNEFPTYKETNYYFHPEGILRKEAVGEENENGPSTFVYDPTYPVPTLGGNNLVLPTCGPYDQTLLEERDDVLSWTSEPLEEAVAITGIVSVTLFVSSSANDTDFTAKLTDVYDGKSYNIIDNVVRMRWRLDPSTVHLMVPGDVYEVTIPLGTTSYVFNVGHSIRVDISSSNHPRFSANLNNGNTILEKGDPVVATNTIYHDAARPSQLILPVVSLDELTQAPSKAN